MYNYTRFGLFLPSLIKSKMVFNPALTLPMLNYRTKPLARLNKELPLTPGTEMISSLEDENDILRRENQELKSQLDSWLHQVKKYRQITIASRRAMKQFASGIGQLQEAFIAMEEAERLAKEEWGMYQTDLQLRDGHAEHQI